MAKNGFYVIAHLILKQRFKFGKCESRDSRKQHDPRKIIMGYNFRKHTFYLTPAKFQYFNILLIFGSSGGVLEAAVRTAYNMLTGDDLEQLEFKEFKEMKGIKESSIEILGKEVKVAVASGLANARRLLERIRDGKVHGKKS